MKSKWFGTKIKQYVCLKPKLVLFTVHIVWLVKWLTVMTRSTIVKSKQVSFQSFSENILYLTPFVHDELSFYIFPFAGFHNLWSSEQFQFPYLVLNAFPFWIPSGPHSAQFQPVAEMTPAIVSMNENMKCTCSPLVSALCLETVTSSYDFGVDLDPHLPRT